MDRDQWLDIHNGENLEGCQVGWTLMQTGDKELGQDLLLYTINYMEEVLPRHIERADRRSPWACYYRLGDIEKALDGMERDVTHKTALSYWPSLDNQPELQLLREQPRYQDLDQKVRAELARQRENLAQIDSEAGK